MEQTVKVKEAKSDKARKIKVLYDFGDNLDEMVQKFGDETVHIAALETIKGDLRKMVRARLKANETDDQIQSAVEVWLPSTISGDPKVARIHKLLDQLSGEQQTEILNRYHSDNA